MNDVQRLGGTGLLAMQYKSSLFAALKSVYPHFKWLPWKFSQVPIGYWEHIENHRKFANWLLQFLESKKIEDISMIKVSDIRGQGGTGLLEYHDNLLSAITTVSELSLGYYIRNESSTVFFPRSSQSTLGLRKTLVI